MTAASCQSRVSVVVPVYNGSSTISRTITCLLSQNYPPLEVIIIDDGSNDDTAQVVKAFNDKIIYRYQPNRGPAAARNAGISLAGGDLIAFTDSDCMPAADWLLTLLAGFDSPAIAGVGGLIKSADGSWIGEYIDEAGFLNPQSDQQAQIPYLITANACFRRDVLIEAGLFDERFRKPGGEEPELCLRIKTLGYQFRLVKDAIVFHHHRQTIANLLKTIANYGEGAFIFGQLSPERRLANPRANLVKLLLKLPLALRSVPSYQSRYGFKKALCFSILDHLRHIALWAGYLRGMRRAA